ncbi:hypothetical protein AB0N06_13325 [Streptomyces sp. NPDC051020]|uniref:hypothetical protein n=1 Tax=Streptomyces sp. NPDC051020 TaxID=3155409 RepID=UPI00343C7DDC
MYGSPVLGQDAPPDTVGPASRAVLALVDVVKAADAAGRSPRSPGAGGDTRG